MIVFTTTKLAEWLQTHPNIKELEEKHKALLDLIKFPNDIFHTKKDFVQANPDSINKRVIVNGVRLPTQNVMLVDGNLMADIWDHLRRALVSSVEAIFILLVHPEENLRKSPL